MKGRPTELAITLAAFVRGTNDWRCADEIAHRLQLLGFEATAQQVAAWLRPMCECECPWFEREQTSWGPWSYRVTTYGVCDIENRTTLRVPKREVAA